MYWVDSVWARIEVLSLDNMERAEILRVGTNTRPRAIAVDPLNRYIHNVIDKTHILHIHYLGMYSSSGLCSGQTGARQPR